MEYYLAVKQSHDKFVSKWVELEKNHPDCGNLDPERQTWCILTYKKILDVNQRITTTSKKTGIKKDT